MLAFSTMQFLMWPGSVRFSEVTSYSYLPPDITRVTRTTQYEAESAGDSDWTGIGTTPRRPVTSISNLGD